MRTITVGNCLSSNDATVAAANAATSGEGPIQNEVVTPSARRRAIKNNVQPQDRRPLSSYTKLMIKNWKYKKINQSAKLHKKVSAAGHVPIKSQN